MGKAITVNASYLDGYGANERVSSNPTPAVTNVNDLPTGGIAITGTIAQYGILTADTSTLADQDGLGTLNYQWFANGTAISGATSATYTLTQAEVDKAITVNASYLDGYGANERVSSNPTPEVLNVNDLPSGNLIISGRNTELNTLTTINTLTDLDGLGNFNYQWLANGIAIANATDSKYTLTKSDIGKAISVQTNYIDSYGAHELVTSATTNIIGHVLSTHKASEKILGSNGDDYINVTAKNASLTGGLGSDIFMINSGTNTIKDLGLGNDTLCVSKGASVKATLTGNFCPNSSSDNNGVISINDSNNFNIDLSYLLGSKGVTIHAEKSASNINLAGGYNNDTITGGTGNDTISGGAGTNLLTGGAGNNTFIASNFSYDSITDLKIGDIINVYANSTLNATSLNGWVANTSSFNNGSLLINTLKSVDISNINGTGKITINNIGKNNITLIGGNQQTILNGGTGNDELIAGNGPTTLNGGYGNDTYTINSVDDTVFEDRNAGNDTLNSSIDYTLPDNVENLTLTGNKATLAIGNTLDNILTTNSSNDTLIGLAGNDTYIVNSTLDVVIENVNEGTDLIKSSVSYTLPDNVENITLVGNSSIDANGNNLNNILMGNTGNNSLDGGTGNDLLIGNGGHDTLTGGTGSDTFLYNAKPEENNKIIITDFTTGLDKLQFSVPMLNKLGNLGHFANDDEAFVSNVTGKADNGHERLIYNSSTGILSYDPDGNGHSAPTAIVVLGTGPSHPDLHASDLFAVG